MFLCINRRGNIQNIQ